MPCESLPDHMIDIIPKTDQGVQRSRYLLYGAYALLGATILSFGILKILQSRALTTLANAQILLAQSKTPEEKNLERNVLSARDRLQDAVLVIASATDPLPMFSSLERAVLPAITFTDIKISMGDSAAVVTGEGPDFYAIDRQIRALSAIDGVSRLELSSLGFNSKGTITFTIRVTLSQ